MSENYNFTASLEQLSQCPMCMSLNPIDETYCLQCHRHLYSNSHVSIQKTIALLITSFVLFIPANLLPMMSTTLLGTTTENTILGGIIVLWQNQSYPVAIIIFFASIVIPITKLLALSWLCYNVSFHNFSSKRTGHNLYRITELIGRWSMIDIFVVAILVAMIQRGILIRVEPGFAAIAFTALVICTMLAAITFDPRLIWQQNLNEDINVKRK